VNQLHYWALELVEFRIGDVILGGSRHKSSNLKKLIVDSGTTYFTTPSELQDTVRSHMPEASCANVENYSPLTYVLRGVDGETFELIVTQETYMIGSANDEGSCRPAFMALDVNEKYGPALILGEVFMRHFFTVFSRGDGSEEQAKIGFAAAKIGAVPKVRSKAKQLPREDAEPAFASKVDRRGDVLAEMAARAVPSADADEKPEVIRRSSTRRSSVPCVPLEDCEEQVAVSDLATPPNATRQVTEVASFLQTPRGAKRINHGEPRSVPIHAPREVGQRTLIRRHAA